MQSWVQAAGWQIRILSAYITPLQLHASHTTPILFTTTHERWRYIHKLVKWCQTTDKSCERVRPVISSFNLLSEYIKPTWREWVFAISAASRLPSWIWTFWCRIWRMKFPRNLRKYAAPGVDMQNIKFRGIFTFENHAPLHALNGLYTPETCNFETNNEIIIVKKQ